MVGAVILARRGQGWSSAVITLNHYLALSAMLFAIGTAGVFLRRNVITLASVDRDHAQCGET
jgi:hypothetical protein